MSVSETALDATGLSLGRRAELALERTGGASLLIFEDQRWTGAQLAARSRRLSGGLREAGLAPGDRVVVCMANCPEVGITYQAVWRAGAAVTPVLFLLGEHELRHVITDSGAAFAVTTPEFLDKVRAAGRGVPTLRAVVLAEGAVPPGTADGSDGGPPVLSFAELEQADEGDLVDVASTEMAALLYTGGTTGRAKGVMISHDNLSAAAASAYQARIGDGLPGLSALPMSHVYGLSVSVMSMHSTQPGLAVLMRWFEPVQWLRLVEQHAIAQGPIVPQMARMLLDQPLEKYNLSSLRRITSGGAPLPPDVAREWSERLPWVELVEGYGCTEATAVVTSMPVGDVRYGSVGRAAPGVELRIERPDGTAAAPGEDGEICVRGPAVMMGYWRSPEATEQVMRGGWLHTGDVGHLDEDGFLYVVDRIKDVIIRGGFNVYPRDVEDAMTSHPEVAACGVVGRPDPRHGEEVVAFVQLTPGATVTPEELIAYCRERVGAVKYPREVHILPALPLTSVLKTDRKALRAMLADKPADKAAGGPAEGAEDEAGEGDAGSA